MPESFNIYKVKCHACGYRKIFSGVGRAFIRANGRVRHLMMGYECGSLKAEGLTWNEAVRQGRLLDCQTLLCRACGALYERREIASLEAGCGLFLVMVLANILLIAAAEILVAYLLCFLSGYDAGSTVLGGAATVAIMAMGAIWAGCSGWPPRRAAHHRESSAPESPCQCDPPDPRNLVRPEEAFDIVFPCPKCGEKDLQCSRFRSWEEA